MVVFYVRCRDILLWSKFDICEIDKMVVDDVVFTDISLEKAIQYDDYCHNHQPPIPFIKSEVCGLFGSMFCDFGPEFTVTDVDREEPHTGIIEVKVHACCE
ncbi:ubiquitin-activating enzyme E1 2-like [Iris pallida]|uniref:Ubiquitin-activating enzyme E1 2-like n=1 Tax=Iris pallida TaxID=29817 RepID=A0AAX6G9C0_IRIPA|nr:ubiquitin-activating enzyme E1 2-like [Iris pallida]